VQIVTLVGKLSLSRLRVLTTMSDATGTTRDVLDDKVNRVFAGKVV
jgi:hypothetical protein